MDDSILGVKLLGPMAPAWAVAVDVSLVELPGDAPLGPEITSPS